MKNFVRALGVILLVFTSACGKDSNKGAGGGESGPQPQTELSGTYVSQCVPQSPVAVSVRSRLVVDAKLSTLTTILYDSEDCSGNVVILSGASFRPGPIGVAFGEGNAIDLTFASTAFMPVASELASRWNSAAYCGVSDWRAGTYRDITGRTCGEQRMPSSGETLAAIILVGSNTIRFAVADPAAPTVRPSRLDAEVFTRTR